MRKFDCRAVIIHTQILISLERKAAGDKLNQSFFAHVAFNEKSEFPGRCHKNQTHNTSGTVIFGQSAIRSGGGADECDLTLMHRSGERASFPLSAEIAFR